MTVTWTPNQRHLQVKALIDRHPDGLTSTQVAAALNITTPIAADALGSLYVHGLVDRDPPSRGRQPRYLPEPQEAT